MAIAASVGHFTQLGQWPRQDASRIDILLLVVVPFMKPGTDQMGYVMADLGLGLAQRAYSRLPTDDGSGCMNTASIPFDSLLFLVMAMAI